MSTRQSILTGFLTAALLPFAASDAVAARLLHVNVDVDGQQVLSAIMSDDGTSSGPELWQQLGGKRQWSEESPVVPSTKGGLQATLQGNIVIRIGHVNRSIIEATTKELTLTRLSPSAKEWSISAAELDRIRQENNIPVPPPLLSSAAVTIIVLPAIVGVISLGLVAWVLFATRRPSRVHE